MKERKEVQQGIGKSSAVRFTNPCTGCFYFGKKKHIERDIFQKYFQTLEVKKLSAWIGKGLSICKVCIAVFVPADEIHYSV